jgi:hypothetical protein
MNIPPDEGYPMSTDRCPRRLIASGKGKRQEIREQLVRLQEQANRKRGVTDVSGNPRESIDFDHYGAVMAERRKREAEGL